jgi:hypothetical protein
MERFSTLCAVELTRTMCPAEPPDFPCFFICATECFTSAKTLSRLMAMVLRHCASAILSMGASCGGHTPWFATRMSSRPNCFTAAATSSCAVSVPEIAGQAAQFSCRVL